MRFRRLEARVFGVLLGRRLELPPEAVLVFGSNESGKSAFPAALETILFGFDPANREEHPLAAWDGGASGDLDLEAVIERDDGVTLRIERELLSRARLRLAEGDAGFAGSRQSNAPLDCVGGLSRELFRAVYSLELEQPRGARRRRSRSTSTSCCSRRPRRFRCGRSRSCATSCARRIRRSGAPIGAATRAQASWPRRSSCSARSWALRLRASVSCAARGRSRRSSARASVHSRRSGASSARPITKRRSWAVSTIGSAAAVRSDHPSIFRAWASSRSRIPSRSRARSRGSRRAAASPARGSDASRKRSPRRSALCSRRPPTSSSRARRRASTAPKASAATRRSRHSVALRESAARDLTALLGRAATAADLEGARAPLPLEALRAAHADWSAARSAPIGSGGGPTPVRALVAAVVSFANAALLPWLEPLLGTLARPLALAAGALGIAALLAAFFVSRRPRPAPPQLAGLLAGLGPAAGLCENPAALLRMLERLERAQDTLGELRGSEAAEAELAAAASSRAERLARLCASLGVSAEGDVEACVARLSEALRHSRERAQQVELDRQERLRAGETLDTLRPGLERLTAQLERVEAVLKSVEPEALPGAAFARVEARRQAAQSLREIEDELRRDPRFAALEHDARVAAERDPSDAEWSPRRWPGARPNARACAEELAAAHTRLGEIANLLREDPGSRQARVADLDRAAEEELEATGASATAWRSSNRS